MAAKLSELGDKGKIEDRRNTIATKVSRVWKDDMVVKGESTWSHIKGRSFVEVLKVERSHSSNKIWLDVREKVVEGGNG